MSKEVKYLGIIFDDKLMRNANMRAKVKKWLRGVWLCNAFTGKSRGLSPNVALSPYKDVIIPKITSVAVALWDRMHIDFGRSELERLQRTACIL